MLEGFKEISKLPIDWIEPKFRLAVKILKNILFDQKCGKPQMITGSLCSRISTAHIAPSSVLLQRDRFKDIDFLVLENDFVSTSIDINNLKYDKVNFYLKRIEDRIFYDIDSSLCEIAYDINQEMIFATDGCLRTFDSNAIYPPHWFISGQDPNIHIDIRKEQIGKPFQRATEKYVQISDEMIEYMNFLIEHIYNQNQKYLEIQAITDFPIDKYQPVIDQIEGKLSKQWQWFFEQCRNKPTETDIAQAYSQKYAFLKNGKF